MHQRKPKDSKIIESHKQLLDIIPGMVLLITEKQTIRYANPAAIDFLGEITTPELLDKKRKEQLHTLLKKIKEIITTNIIETAQEITLGKSHLEVTAVPANENNAENLYWIFIRDITQNKKQLAELALFHNSIETILTNKIKELNESERMRQNISSELNALKEQLQQAPSDGEMIGTSQALRELQEMIFQVAKSDATILITGESGTGKEIVANLIKEHSSRCDKPFLKINCNTISESLLESDLFGHEKGAYTGAVSMQKGKFEVVDGGTIFLDEIGDISPRMQAALLRVLQDREIIRVGSNRTITVDVRIIAATNRNLQKMVSDGSFRLDLFYRLNIINLSIPPLRERKEDIVDLTTHFIRKYRKAFRKEISFLPQSVLDHLLKHHWPGNVRELENVIQRAVLMAKNNAITENELSFDTPAEGHDATYTKISTNFAGKPLKTIVSETEKDVIISTLKSHYGNVNRVAKELAVGKTALYDKMKRYDISAKSFKKN